MPLGVDFEVPVVILNKLGGRCTMLQSTGAAILDEKKVNNDCLSGPLIIKRSPLVDATSTWKQF